jgi:hypothetical protein
MGMIGWKSIGLGLVAGGACAVALYTSVGAGVAPVSSTQPMSGAASSATPSVVYLDCTPPAQLEGDACITRITETVLAPAPPAAPRPAAPAGKVAAPASTTPRPSAAASTSPTGEHEGEHEGEHDDHGDDDGGHDDD